MALTLLVEMSGERGEVNSLPSDDLSIRESLGAWTRAWVTTYYFQMKMEDPFEVRPNTDAGMHALKVHYE